MPPTGPSFPACTITTSTGIPPPRRCHRSQSGRGRCTVADDLARVLAGAVIGEDGWIRAVGYHEAVAGPFRYRATLDELAPAVPVRVQHRSGVLWTLNSAGLACVGLPEHPDGRLRSTDQNWSNSLQRRESGLAEVSRRLASYGLTGVTDATPGLGIADLVKFAEAQRHGELVQGVTGLAPGKRILHDDGLDLDELTRWIGARHAAGGTVALHCVTAAQLVVTIAALDAAGVRPGDRVEHAAVVPDDCLPELARLGVTVVTQPNFVAERGDQYLADVAAAEHHQLWRVASLFAAGAVEVAMSTDMPFGDGDPVGGDAGRRAPHHRMGAVLGPAERIDARTALEMFLGDPGQPSRPRTVAPGQPANLCVLAASPEEVLRELDADLVAATMIEGSVVFDRA